MTDKTPEERAESCLLEPSRPGVNQLTKMIIAGHIREAENAALERAARGLLVGPSGLSNPEIARRIRNYKSRVKP